MAIIQSIRNRGGLLVAIIIGMALVAFILGDALTSGSIFRRKSQMTVAEINGTKVQYPEYQNQIARIEQIMKAQYQLNSLNQEMSESVRNQAWQDLLQRYVLDREYDKLGLAVSDAELSDQVQGANPHPIVQQMFTNPQTGVLDRLQLSEFLSRLGDLTGEPKMIWAYYENMIAKERLYTKYNSLVQNGLYVTSLQAKKREDNLSTSASISFVQKPYSSVSDSAISVSEAEMKKYYKEHKELYKQDETRNLKYVAFEKIPSEKDYQTALDWVESRMESFKAVKNVEAFVTSNANIYDNTNYSRDELSDSLAEFMFNAEIGDVYGPYFEDDAYKAAKLAKINYLSDSVRVSHILLPATQQNVQQIQALADSLVELAQGGYNFGQLVEENSRDMQTYLQKGDLGWIIEGTKGQAFSDSAFYAEKGEVKLTFSQEGFHVIKVTDKSAPVKKVQVGIISKPVTPGPETDQFYYSKAVQFLNSNKTLEQFEASTKDNDPRPIPVIGLQPLDREIQGLEDSREIVRWAFEEAEVGDIYSSTTDFGGKYVVAVLVKKNEAGYSPYEDVVSNIEVELRKQKKAEMIQKEMQDALAGSQSVDEVASALNLPVKSATDIRFTSFQIREVGSEPKLIAAAVNAEEGAIKGPLAGENGVYVFTVDDRETEENPNTNTALTQNYLERSYSARANRQSFEVLKELAEIDDNRGRFF